MQETRTCHAAFLNDLTDQYLKFHRAKEGAFWETRMGLADRHDTLSKADVQLQEFLSDADTLAELRRRREAEGLSVDQETILDGWILMFSRNQVENPDARVLRKESVEFENALQRARGEMKLGYTDPRSGEFVPASSVALANGLRSGKDAAFRKACFEGLRSIETFVLDQDYCRVVRDRNRFARMLGFEDYYDYKVLWAEGFDKKTLFGYLDDLEERTREKAAHERKALASREGEDALEPWNFPYHTWGSIQTERDAYFRFEDSIDRWARSFAALGIRYRDARITLDLVDRKGKYENGFMHGPSPAFFRGEDWQPAEINFTANALPDKPGSGFRALQTLFHEGGHAAHFSNILMGAPCFSQEYAPTSVAFAETQSMFLDSILEDADWQVRYALDESGRPMSADLVEKGVRITHPFLAQNIRNMLVVCYAEKELYEMAEEDLTP
ncbi:MAG: M3 family metallopeptidase, partial [Gemmatimonadota bacterium]|nr:M3 family metallopeptidase [Gemmatimonadota bacterium]